MKNNFKDNKAGFSLIEVLVSLLVISVLISGVYALIVLSLRISADNKNYVEAIEIVNQRMEQIRNMPYLDVGVISGVPAGTIPQEEDVIRNGQATIFKVYTYVTFNDDSYDGLAGAGDTIITDYKIATIKITWESNYGPKEMTVFSKIIPKTVETTSGYGLLKILVNDANGAPVPNVNVRTVNNITVPTIDVTNITDTSGVLYLPVPQSFQSYEITVDKAGYGTDYSVALASPYMPKHLSATVGLKTDESFSIDKLANLNITVYSDSLPANWLVNKATSSDIKSKVKIASDNSANIYFVWQEDNTASSSLYLQKYNSANVKQWLDDVLVSTSTYQSNPDIAVAKDGTVYTVWQDNSIAMKAVAYAPLEKKIADGKNIKIEDKKSPGLSIKIGLRDSWQKINDKIIKIVNNCNSEIKERLLAPVGNYSQKLFTKFGKYFKNNEAVALGFGGIVQSKIGATGTGNTLTATFDNNPVSGNMIIAIAVSRNDNITFNPPYNTSGTFIQSAYSDSNWYQDVGIWHKVIGAGESKTVTVKTVSGNVDGGVLMLLEVSGLNTSNPIDVISVNDQNGTTALTADTGTTAVNSTNASFAVAAVAFADDNFTTPTSANWSSISSAVYSQQLWHDWSLGTDGSLAVAWANINSAQLQKATLVLSGGGAEQRNSALAVFRVLNNAVAGSFNSQVTAMDTPSANQYLGGSFVFSSSIANTINSIKISEKGTVDAQNNLENIKLYYDIDSGAPYDCASEVYNAGSDLQFGGIANFDSANGSTTFSGSAGIDATHSLCVYTVLDVKNTANKDDTIEIEISNPESDVIVSSGVMTPSSPVMISGQTDLLKPAELRQIHYRFRNDDGDETTATWSKNEDENISSKRESLIRLRFEISNEGSYDSLLTAYRVEYGKKITSCDAVAIWEAVPNDNTLHWRMSDSVNITNNEPTSNISGLFDENSNFIASEVKDSDNQTSVATLLGANDFTEIEYSLEATANATEDDYCFRLTNAGSVIEFSYLKYPEVSIIGDNNIYIKSFDSSGNELWGARRINLNTSNSDQQNPRIAITENFGDATTTVVWEDNRNGNLDVYGQIIDKSGNKLLASDLQITSSSTDESKPTVLIDGEDNIYVSWLESGDVYLHKFDLSGGALWANAINITNSADNDFSPEISYKGTSSVMMTWTSLEVSNNVYLANFDNNGNQLWKVKTNIESDASSQFYSDICNDDNNIYVAWTDNRSGNNDIFTQKYNFSGTAQWAKDQKINDNYNATDQRSPVITLSSDANIFSAWYDEREGSGEIYGVQVEDLGVAIPKANMPLVVTGTRKQTIVPRDFTSDASGKISIILEHDNSYTIVASSTLTSLNITSCQPTACPITIVPDEIRDLEVYVQ
jgi:prepilin-type N-terminal cleavage/methylation domain-containing protein